MPSLPDVVDQASSHIGDPYQFGGADCFGTDCSGLIQQAFKGAGMTVPRSAHELYSAAQRVDPGQLQRGDLLFLQGTQSAIPAGRASHVGIYDGAGNVIAASSAAGKVVRQPVTFFTQSKHFL